MNRLYTRSALLWALVVWQAHSQSTPQNTSLKARAVQVDTFDPSLNSAVSSPSAQLALEGSTDNLLAKARVGVQVSDFTLEAKFTAPITKDDSDKTINLTTLDGLANKASADFGISFERWHPKSPLLAQNYICALYIRNEVKKFDSDEAAIAWMAERNAEGEPNFICGDFNLPKEYRKKSFQAISFDRPLIGTMRFKVAKQKYKYALPTAYVDASTNQTPMSGTVAVGTFTDLTGFLQLSYQYQSDWESGTVSDVCTPLASSSSTSCRSIATSLPERSLKSILQLEMRRFYGKSFGIGPQISGDLKGRVAAVNVPVYFFKSKDGGLNGGLSMGWKSDTNDVSFSVFVGQVLTLISR